MGHDQEIRVMAGRGHKPRDMGGFSMQKKARKLMILFSFQKKRNLTDSLI